MSDQYFNLLLEASVIFDQDSKNNFNVTYDAVKYGANFYRRLGTLIDDYMLFFKSMWTHLTSKISKYTRNNQIDARSFMQKMNYRERVTLIKWFETETGTIVNNRTISYSDYFFAGIQCNLDLKAMNEIWGDDLGPVRWVQFSSFRYRVQYIDIIAFYHSLSDDDKHLLVDWYNRFMNDQAAKK